MMEMVGALLIGDEDSDTIQAMPAKITERAQNIINAVLAKRGIGSVQVACERAVHDSAPNF